MNESKPNLSPNAEARPDPQIRRIVTGHDKDGKAVVWIDGFATNHKYPNPRMISTLLWCTDEAPGDFMKDEDFGSRVLGTAPPPNGTRCMFSVLQPGHAAKEWPHMHRTDTIDYKVIISGEVTMYLDNSKVVCKPGDIIIQRGTNHAWVNEGSAPCRSMTVLVDGKPKREGSVSGMHTQKL